MKRQKPDDPKRGLPAAGAQADLFALTVPKEAPLPAAREEPAPEPPARLVLTVAELTRQIKGALERGFPTVCVRGEISNFRGPHPRGHLYFALKDALASVDTKIWASVASRLKFKVRDGMEVIAEGSVEVYEPQGRYSLIVRRLEPAGEGALALAFAQLKERLMAEGLFGEKRIRAPRPLPFLPRRIGVVTSRSGAALRDFLRVLHQRHPRLSVLVCDARVQGEGASFEVVRAIERLSRTDVDVIVVTRGGGSAEDLWTFNEENVARAIFACPVPVVSAIGHEVDFTIADFVADFRAPTPSAAAERLAPVLSELELGLKTAEGRLRKGAERRVLVGRQAITVLAARLSDPRRVLGQKQLYLAAQTDRLSRAARLHVGRLREAHQARAVRLNRQRPAVKLRVMREELGRLRVSLLRASPGKRVAAEGKLLAALGVAVGEGVKRRLVAERARTEQFGARLGALSPLKVMARGYAVVFREPSGRVLRSASEANVGDRLQIRLARSGVKRLEDCETVNAEVTAPRRPRGRH